MVGPLNWCVQANDTLRKLASFPEIDRVAFVMVTPCGLASDLSVLFAESLHIYAEAALFLRLQAVHSSPLAIRVRLRCEVGQDDALPCRFGDFVEIILSRRRRISIWVAVLVIVHHHRWRRRGPAMRIVPEDRVGGDLVPKIRPVVQTGNVVHWKLKVDVE